MKKKIDVVIISARYVPDDGRLLMAQAYQRLGPIWSDILLYDLERVVELLREGRHVVTGYPKQIPGEFGVLAKVRLVSGKVVVDRRLGMSENLGVPTF